jgi:signal recognition particle GTPase
VVELKALKGMLDAMTDAELEDPELIKAAARDRIAKASGKTTDDVSKLMYSYRQTLIVHAWLHLK